MIDIDLYKNIFEKFTFDIHEYYETGKAGKLKNFVYEINDKFPINPYDSGIKYTTSLDYKIEAFIRKSGMGMDEKEIRLQIKDKIISTSMVRDLIELRRLELIYY